MLRRDNVTYLRHKAAQIRALAVELAHPVSDEMRALADEIDLYAAEIESRPNSESHR